MTSVRRKDMFKPRRLKRGDKVAIISLSKGLLGEEFVEHNLILGKRDWKIMG